LPDRGRRCSCLIEDENELDQARKAECDDAQHEKLLVASGPLRDLGVLERRLPCLPDLTEKFRRALLKHLLRPVHFAQVSVERDGWHQQEDAARDGEPLGQRTPGVEGHVQSRSLMATAAFCQR
jgi:hypothetical protein